MNEQRSALRIVESRLCRGCDEPCGEAEYCRDCAIEVTEGDIEELERMYAGKPAMRADALRVFRGIGRRAAKWLWIPNLILVGGGILYLAGVYGYALLKWIQLGVWR
jgi:hypothetical protein